VLSTAKIGTASWRYYQRTVGRGACEYYLGVGEAPGRWHGRGLDDLGLEPDALVRERQLEALFARAMHPDTREQLGRAWRENGVTGYDLCFSAPKSVSALWASGEPEAMRHIRAAHRAAVKAALGYLDSHAALSRVGTNGVRQVDTSGFAAALFTHRTSRAGDPQLHTHALVVNKVKCPDGGWRSIDGTEIYAHKKSAGAIYQAGLRAELTRRLGVAWEPVNAHGQAEIAGVPRELCQAWSKRARQVEDAARPVIAAYEDKLGRQLTSTERTAVSKVAVLQSRPGKEHVAAGTLFDRWYREAKAMGWDDERLSTSVRTAARAAPTLSRRAVAERTDGLLAEAVEAAGARRAVFSRSDLAVEIAARLPVMGVDAAGAVEWVERLTDRAAEHAVRLVDEPGRTVRRSDARYASRSTLAAEARILARADAGRQAGYGLATDDGLRLSIDFQRLDETQASAVRELVFRGDFLSVLVAPAGTGKTTAVGAAAEVWRWSGYRVLGLAPSARAAAELGDATRSDCETVAKFFYERDRRPSYLRRGTPYGIDDRTVVVVDEASMLGTAELDRLSELAAYHGAKITLVGDPEQLGSIDRASGLLPLLAQRIDAPSLERLHRFADPAEAHATLQLRAGNPEALETYRALERIHPAASGEQAVAAVIAHWQQQTAAGRTVLMLARSRADVDALNAAARAHAIEAGVVRGPALLGADTDWRAGDVLRATRNERRIDIGGQPLRNGDRFTVLTADHGGLRVAHQRTGAEAVLPAAYVREHEAYGWASTIDSAQGATVDVGVLLARPGLDRAHLYVGMTRGRLANHVHTAPTEVREPHHLPAPVGGGDVEQAERMLADAIAVPGREQAAHGRLGPAHAARPEAERRPGADPYRFDPAPKAVRFADPDYLIAAQRTLAEAQRRAADLRSTLNEQRRERADLIAQTGDANPWHKRGLTRRARTTAATLNDTGSKLGEAERAVEKAAGELRGCHQQATTERDAIVLERDEREQARRDAPLLAEPTSPQQLAVRRTRAGLRRSRPGLRRALPDLSLDPYEHGLSPEPPQPDYGRDFGR
jgi:conjugative relaxase-like TrwC/TraI family protein